MKTADTDSIGCFSVTDGRSLKFFLYIFLGRASEFGVEGAVEGSHRRESAFKAAVGHTVFLLAHKHYRIFKSYYGQIFYKSNVEAVFKISRNVAWTVAEVRRYLRRSYTTLVIFVNVEENT